jgi:hypothetical protein
MYVKNRQTKHTETADLLQTTHVSIGVYAAHFSPLRTSCTTSPCLFSGAFRAQSIRGLALAFRPHMYHNMRAANKTPVTQASGITVSIWRGLRVRASLSPPSVLRGSLCAVISETLFAVMLEAGKGTIFA